MAQEKVLCRRCSSFRSGGDWSGPFCANEACYEATGYDPITGKETTKRVKDYGVLNANLDCEYFKKKWFLL